MTRIANATRGLLAGALVLATLPVGSGAARAAMPGAEVSVRDNFFAPEEVHIEPGEMVTWKTSGSRKHSVTASDRSYDSGSLTSGDEFARHFRKEGVYRYFCKFHGTRSGGGMAGVVVVGEPEELTIQVPAEAPTIQDAIDDAIAGSTIEVAPGVYDEAVSVYRDDITIVGADRFRTVLDGGGDRTNGIVVTGDGVTIKRLTVRDHVGSGIVVDHVRGYTIKKVDLINNSTYGVLAYDSYHGDITQSFGWGSGDAAFYIGSCSGCSTVVTDVVARRNYMGLAATNVTGLVIQSSTFSDNGLGIAILSEPGSVYAASRSATLIDNDISDNNYLDAPEPDVYEPIGIPMGTGIWLDGVANVDILANSLGGHELFGIVVAADDEAPSTNVRIAGNAAGGPGTQLAWDGLGSDVCFEANQATSAGPEDLETRYACSQRPFVGLRYEPVRDALEEAIAASLTRSAGDPGEPDRP